MKKKGRWFEKLTKAELKHLKETAGVTTRLGLTRTLEAQAELRASGRWSEPCWVCRGIAVKLGEPV
jgi:hypothetical protein